MVKLTTFVTKSIEDVGGTIETFPRLPNTLVVTGPSGEQYILRVEKATKGKLEVLHNINRCNDLPF